MPPTVKQVDRVLFLDTCAILDVLRFGLRTLGSRTDLESVQRLVNLAESDDSALAIAAADIVPNELQYHRTEVAEQARKEARSIVKRAIALSDLGELLGMKAIAGTPQIRRLGLAESWHDDLVGALDLLVERILNVAQIVEVTEEDRHAADRRVRGRLPPAEQGSSATYDCQITEAALRVAAQRPSSSTLLLTSNTRDFCEGASLYPSLQAQFDDAGLLFVKSWGEARGRLHDLFVQDGDDRDT